MINDTILNYQILSRIGSGGMGTVYLARHTTLERYAAVKVLNAEYSNNRFFKERFLNEATTLAKLNNANIVTLYDFVEQEGKLLIIMEYVEGTTLDIILEQNSFHSEDYIIGIITQVLDGLSYAHKQGVIHRDIKPSNIIVSKDFQSKLLDFGIAKLTQANNNLTSAGTKMGSLNYMSPEQVLGKELDYRSDIYSAGIVLYELICGRLPFDSGTESDFVIQNRIVNDNLPDIGMFRNDISERLKKSIEIATSKDPDHRFNSCEEFKSYILGQTAGTHLPQPSREFQQNKTTFIPPSQKQNQTIYQASNLYEKAGAHKSPKNYTTLILGIIIVLAGVTIFLLMNKNDETISVASNTQNLNSINNGQENKNLNSSTRSDETLPPQTRRQNSSTPGKFPEGSIKYLTYDDIKYLSKSDLRIMRNEIFARHGYIFRTNPDMVTHFNNQSWYSPQYSNVDNMLTEIEKHNISFIKSYE